MRTSVAGVNPLQPFSAGFHLKSAGLKSQLDIRIIVEPVGHLIMVRNSVLADRAEVDPAAAFRAASNAANDNRILHA